MSEHRGYTPEEQIACVRRELAMRKRVYPKWVAIGKMKPEAADHEINCMQAVHDTLTAPQPEKTTSETNGMTGEMFAKHCAQIAVLASTWARDWLHPIDRDRLVALSDARRFTTEIDAVLNRLLDEAIKNEPPAP